MILSVSRRTDIPAFYSRWFINRIKEGYVYVRNPMNAHQVSKVKITPDVVDCIVFWTKNAAPLLPYLEELSGYDYYFQFTVNSYEKEIEPNVPPLENRIETFKALSEKLGSERVIWRYDPILFTLKYSPEKHLEMFSHIAEQLKGYTEKEVFSLVDIYPSKNAGNLTKLGAYTLPPDRLDEFCGELAGIAHANNFKIATCAEKIDLIKHGIEHNSCIDKELIERITESELDVKKDGQRPDCQCVKCDDIGSYDTCPHSCVYCYANFRPNVVSEKMKNYDPASPLLCDKIDMQSDKISDRPVRSLKKALSYDQLKLF